ncbi:ScbA/BarX family gamma-butyrolactone biosynthesis protein [Streptomyces sp. SM12]|uniref:ScbA/BarX family gamma-butyrolactone biosynthesis protein n=1 Tax=Streptomyces sp. SM12 TaxID=1071602 RepID=UPI000CD51EAB|nr:ScbA/BarX family gamma-butyrolactone biosynthesis protein [Streptomyces sp. SM12]
MPVQPAQRDAGTLFERVSPVSTHKTNRDEVLLRTWWRSAPDRFTVTAEWPAAHPFYVSRLGLRDPLLLSETVRQTLPLLSHAAYRVPEGHQLLWKDFDWVMDPGAALADGSPAGLELHITCEDVKYRRDRASAISLHVDVERDGRPLAAARTRFTIQDRTVYNRLRGRYADAAAATAQAVPLPPPAGRSRFGRDRFEDVVLAATDQPGRWQLRVDPAHPVLFDHLVDHVPGMLLLEGARQAALATAHPAPTAVVGMDSAFVRYAELDAPCWLEVEGSPESGTVRVSARQHDQEIFHSTVTLIPVPATA